MAPWWALIWGRVEWRDGLHAEIPLRVLGVAEQIDLLVTVDTGFTEYLVLPTETIRGLRLERRYQKDLLAAGDREMRVNVYDAMVELDGETFEIEVYEADGPPLVGMALLTGCRLSIHVTTGGEVAVERV